MQGCHTYEGIRLGKWKLSLVWFWLDRRDRWDRCFWRGGTGQPECQGLWGSSLCKCLVVVASILAEKTRVYSFRVEDLTSAGRGEEGAGGASSQTKQGRKAERSPPALRRSVSHDWHICSSRHCWHQVQLRDCSSHKGMWLQ